MKKFILLLMILSMPFNVLAYSDYIYLGGNTIGIEVKTDGVLVVGFYQIKGKYNKSDLVSGDYIRKVNDIEVNTLNELTSVIEKYTNDKEVNITYARNGFLYNTKLKLVEENGVYKTGLYVKDSIMGIGTLTYIDPETLIYGALGHEIVHGDSSKIIEIKDGSIFKNSILSIDKSSIGNAGSKNAKYYYNTKYGNIEKNTNHGIFGIYTKSTDNYQLVMVSNNIKIGDAYIYTVLEDNKVEKFKINIIGINENSDTKNITFEITDEKLIEKAGGVVQGMSGSPIIQNDSIVGVVTHVIVDNPSTGYGLLITKMLEEGEK